MNRIAIYGCEQDESDLFQELSPQFGVSPIITREAASVSNASLSHGSQCISVSHKTEVAKPVILALKEAGVKYISTRSIGFNHIDVETAEKAGMTVGNAIYSPDGVADCTIMLMLMAARNAKAIVSRAEIRDYSLNGVRGKELRDMAVGVIGTGRIGTAVIERLRGFGCKVLACGRTPIIGANCATLNELLRESDIVSLHTPLNRETHHLLNGSRIALMKDGAYAINTGRGQLIDTQALIAALESGKLGGCALDVIEGEEGVFYFDCSQRPVENKLLFRLQAMPNVIITPHIAYHTKRALREIVEKTIINCLNFRKGKLWPD
jgi:D-specific alpha-keto acid dehydrogenase